MKYLLGLDLGSSSVKGSLLDIESGLCHSSAQSPKSEMSIDSPQPGWAEQDPGTWWKETIEVINELSQGFPGGLGDLIAGIGISYQMHGLVCLDKNHRVLRPAIIWCDSRAVGIGEEAYNGIGATYCKDNLLNSPGNFTASKLAWVKRNEPQVFESIKKVCLPGDYIALQLSGELHTTNTGLSEGIFYDFKTSDVSNLLLEYLEIDRSILPEVADVFSIQSRLSGSVAKQLRLKEGIPISYRAGDQPNNALSLGVYDPGQVAATAGTSGVVYGVSTETISDPQSRVNTFLHVNHSESAPRYGVLMCVNGCGIQNRWMKSALGSQSYDDMNDKASQIDIGSNGLSVFPFGNGAERTLVNRNLGSSISGLDLNRHSVDHLYRATQEGIAYSMMNGIEIMSTVGVSANHIRAGNANMFLSPVFCEILAQISGAEISILETDGSLGAARGAGLGCGIYSNFDQAFNSILPVRTYSPSPDSTDAHSASYNRWKEKLSDIIAQYDRESPD